MDRLKKTLVLVSLVAGAAMGADGPWLTDWEAAKAQAAKGKKPLLIDVSGSDWCGWCMKLDKEVFSQEAFLKAARDKYVMVLLDYPKDKSQQSAELQEQNKRLRGELPIRGFPTVLLATADGVPFARTGYQEGGPEAYLAHLDELAADYRATVALEAKLPTAAGIERARLLAKIIKGMTVPFPKEIEYAEEIIKLDADGKAGLRDESFGLLLARASGWLDREAQDKAAALCDRLLAHQEAPKRLRQHALLTKSQALYDKGDKKGAKALLLEAVKEDPESDISKHVKGLLESEWFKDVD